MTTNKTTTKAMIPSFLQTGCNFASIEVRHKDDLEFHERWVPTSAFVTLAEPASDFEVEAYFGGSHALIDDELPEPISIHDQQIWSECEADDNFEDTATIIRVAA